MNGQHTHMNGQHTYVTSDSTHIFWQPGLKLGIDDFQGDTTANVMLLMRKYKFSASASIGIWAAIDIPKKKSQRRKMPEKIYLAPAFDKTTSFALSDDLVEIAQQTLYFDICEVWARWARKRFSEIRDSLDTPGTVANLYDKILSEMESNRNEMNIQYSREVIMDKKPGALNGWTKLIAKTLVESSEWATKPEECHRLITGVPIERDYMEAPR